MLVAIIECICLFDFHFSLASCIVQVCGPVVCSRLCSTARFVPLGITYCLLYDIDRDNRETYYLAFDIFLISS